MKRRTVELTDRELVLLGEALDSHIYWQLSDETHRNSGYVIDGGSDDAETRRLIRACDRLAAKIGRIGGGAQRRKKMP